MTIFNRIPHLKMNQANPNGNGSGGQANAPQGSSQFAPPQTGGSGDQQQGAQQGQPPPQASKDPYANGGQETPPAENLGEYGPNGEHIAPPAKKQDAVELKYKIDGLEDLSDDEATQIKDFAKTNRLSKEQAQSYLTNYKNLSDKSIQSLKASEKAAQDKELEFRRGEAKKLYAAIGGKDGVEYKENYAKLVQFIGKHLPEFKKELDGGKFFPPSSVMIELHKFREKMTQEDSLETGGAAGGAKTDGGGLFGFYGGNEKK